MSDETTQPPERKRLAFFVDWQIETTINEDETNVELFLTNDGVQQPASIIRFELDTLTAFQNDPLKLAAWWNRFWEILSGDGRNGRNGALARAMSDTAMLHLFYSVYSALMEKGVSPFNKKALLEDYLAMAENLLRRRLGIGAAGRSAEWTEVELAQAIKSVLDNLKPAMRTYEQVADKLREKYGDRAPASGGALRQQVIRLGLNWKNLKRNVPFRRKPATVSYTSPEPKA